MRWLAVTAILLLAGCGAGKGGAGNKADFAERVVAALAHHDRKEIRALMSPNATTRDVNFLLHQQVPATAKATLESHDGPYAADADCSHDAPGSGALAGITLSWTHRWIDLPAAVLHRRCYLYVP